MGSLRLQVYANLAYGAKGIQYYTYWTPKAHDNYDYHDGPISYTGEKTKTYSLVKSMNRADRSTHAKSHLHSRQRRYSP